MSHLFVDTSALMRRYVQETGSDWVRSWIYPRHRNHVYISALTTVEVFSVLVRLEHEKRLSPSDAQRIKAGYPRHARTQYHVVPVDKSVLSLARSVVERHNLRTLDAIQLASVLVVVQTVGTKPTFITGDQRLLTAAAAEGLPIDNPYNHP